VSIIYALEEVPEPLMQYVERNAAYLQWKTAAPHCEQPP